MSYGRELILDLKHCTVAPFTREWIESFCVNLCKLLDMEREDLHFWDYEGDIKAYQEAPDHLRGISAVQFIRTSSITIHALDHFRSMYINIFSCKTFDIELVTHYVKSTAKGEIANSVSLTRV